MNAPGELRGIVHVVDDDVAFRTGIGRLLTAARHVARLYASAAEYLASHDSQGPACLLLDDEQRLPLLGGRIGAQQVLREREDGRQWIVELVNDLGETSPRVGQAFVLVARGKRGAGSRKL